MSAMLGAMVLGVVVPALVAATTTALVLAAGRRLDGAFRFSLAITLGLGLGALAGHVAVSWPAWPAWPPSDVTDRIPYLVLAALLLALVVAVVPARFLTATAWGNRVVLTTVVLTAILGPIYGETWTTTPVLLGGALIGIVMILAWTGLDGVADRLAGAPLLLPLLVWLTGASVVLVLSGSMVLGRLAGALTAALAGCWAASCRSGPVSLTRGGSPVVAANLGSLLLNGYFYAETPTGSVALLALAPAVLGLVLLGPVQRRPTWQKALVAVVAMLAPVAVAVGLAVAAMPSYEY